MSGDCPNCAAKQAEAAQLRIRIAELVGGIRSIAAFIRRQTEQRATMPRQKLIPAITDRLNDLAGR